MGGDIRDEWRLRDIEQKAEKAQRKADEIDQVRSNVDSLERSNRELRSEIAGIRSEFESYKNAVKEAFISNAMFENIDWM